MKIAKVELSHLITFDTTKSRGHALNRLAPEMDPAHEHLELDFNTDEGLLYVSEADTGHLIVLVPQSSIVAMQVSKSEHGEPRAPKAAKTKKE